jgi:phosphatidate cytidylyltransferase
MSGIIFGYATEILPKEITLAEAMLSGVVIGAVAIVSDLLESVLKRKADIKDSGKFIPGIGGALDLADSLLLASPTGFILIWIMLSL